MAENIENKGFAVYNAETNRTGDEAMDAKTRKNIEYLIILLISAAVLAVGWSNRKTIAGWGNQNTEDAMPVADDAAEKFPANDRANHTAHMAFDGSVRDW